MWGEPQFVKRTRSFTPSPSSQLPRGNHSHQHSRRAGGGEAPGAVPSSQLPSGRTHHSGAAEFPAGEAGGAEDDGWLLAMCFNAAQCLTELVVLDAQQLEAGPIAALKLHDSVPHGLHGNWAEEYLGPL